MKRLIYSVTQPSSSLTIGEFIEDVKAMYANRFPNSECIARTRRILGTDFIDIIWLLSKDASETSNNIRENDILHISFDIDIVDEFHDGEVYDVGVYKSTVGADMTMPATVTLNVRSKSYRLAPEVDYMAYSSRELPFRKTTGSPEKILATLQQYVDKLYASLSADVSDGNMHPKDVAFVESKL